MSRRSSAEGRVRGDSRDGTGRLVTVDHLVVRLTCTVIDTCDESVVGLARAAGLPVIATEAGPAHLVKHGENGLTTYCNAASITWALDRLLEDRRAAARMGEAGLRIVEGRLDWPATARFYAELCALTFAELCE